MQVQSLGQEDPLEEEMATHSSILAWKVPWTEEPGKSHFLSDNVLLETREFLQILSCSNTKTQTVI